MTANERPTRDALGSPQGHLVLKFYRPERWTDEQIAEEHQFTAEMFTAVTGMGALLIRYSSALKTDKFFVPVVLLALFGVVLSSVVERLQTRLAPWKETERALCLRAPA